MVVEAKTRNGIEKYWFVDEDIDSFMVCSMDGTKLDDAFTIIRIYDALYGTPIPGETIRCKIVKKENVTACYDDWEIKNSYFGTMRCLCSDIDDYVRVEVNEKPTEYADEFTYEEYDMERGTEFPPIHTSRYYAIVDKDDKRLRRDVITYKHVDYVVNNHGIFYGMTESQRIEAILKYLEEKVGEGSLMGYAQMYSLLLGCYGYKIPDKKLSTNVDLVFGRVIPNAYMIRKKNGRYAGEHFCRDLIDAIVKGYKSCIGIGEKLLFEDGKKQYASMNYQYYMCLQFHLKLMEMHKLRIEPYINLDLKNVSYELEKGCCEYMNKHEPVLWNKKIVNQDIGEYTKWAIKELEYFKAFEYDE